MKFPHGKAYFMRYLISFLLILIIPLSGLLIYMSSAIHQNARKELMFSNQSTLMHIYTMIDGNIDKLRAIASLTHENPGLKPKLLGQSFFNYYKAIQTLKDLTTTNDLIDILLVYDKVNDMVVSNFGTTPEQYFGEEVIPTSLDNGLALKTYIEGLTNPSYAYGGVSISGVGRRRCLLYFYPSSPVNRADEAVIVIVMAVDNMTNLFKSQYNAETSAFALYDADGRLVTKYGALPVTLPEILPRDENGVAHPESLEDQGDPYFVSTLKSPQTEWTYVNVVSFESASKMLSGQLRLCYVLFSLVFVFGGIGLYVAIRLNYAPLLRLKQQAEPFVGGQSLNEEETVRTAIKALMSNLERMKTDMQNVRPAAQNYFLQRVVSGEGENQLRVPPFHDGFATVPEGMYCVAGILSLGKGDYEHAARLLEGICDETLEAHCVHDAFRNTVVGLFCSPSLSRDALLQKVTARVLGALKTPMYFGGVYPLAFVSRAYFEAYITTQMLEHTPRLPRTYTIDDVPGALPNVPSLLYPSLLVDFELAILRLDMQAVLGFPAAFQREITSGSVPFYQYSYLSMELLRIILRAYREKSDRAELLQQLLDYLYTAQPVSSLEQVIDTASYFCTTVFYYMQKTQGERDPMLSDILSFVDAHCVEREFSVQSVSDHFGLTPPWLSHFFKVNMHVTLQDYIKELRMKYAQRCIAEEQTPIQMIADMLGYSNLSSFIRSFKKVVGMTPGQYKELTEKGKDSDDDAKGDIP